MTRTLAELLAQKQQLLERLQMEPGLHEQDEIARLLIRINATLNWLDGTATKTRSKQR
ncbi:hypothetical protein ACVIHI_008991 [Bradyrhizobium sp. USDA 4524]|uniref:hypothetical protein n=1 Tax=unclassified Bradyrhizobium TaxID=2631580 RepID=UPI0020A0B133|nr:MULTISPECIES: hypothetical protein [unclassified Bradyrhizobium]MCP1845543.1 hypothetical protein [Bradyrhizobium sp. USDA 4538]MCP1907135.1 hypothetical protein [Bradyrhizobium sp. USDA 4537]MCP1985611.1 hypothetical protein [Bradyrhizobium sp. USDA 4539]